MVPPFSWPLLTRTCGRRIRFVGMKEVQQESLVTWSFPLHTLVFAPERRKRRPWAVTVWTRAPWKTPWTPQGDPNNLREICHEGITELCGAQKWFHCCSPLRLCTLALYLYFARHVTCSIQVLFHFAGSFLLPTSQAHHLLGVQSAWQPNAGVCRPSRWKPFTSHLLATGRLRQATNYLPCLQGSLTADALLRVVILHV